MKTPFDQFTMADRHTLIGLGSTDMVALSLGEWDRLYDEKIWQITGGKEGKPPQDLSRVFKVQLGKHTESFHRSWRATEWDRQIFHPPEHRETGLGQAFVGDPILDIHKDHVFFASIDGIVMPGENEREFELVELKHTHGNNSVEQAAIFYMPQIQRQMGVTGIHRTRFSAIIGNDLPDHVFIDYDEAFDQRLIEMGRAFWQHIEDRERPLPSKPDAKIKKAAAQIPVNGFKPYDFSGKNEWVTLAHSYAEQKPIADAFKATDKALRKLIPDDASEVSGGPLHAKRDKRGAYRFTITE